MSHISPRSLGGHDLDWVLAQSDWKFGERSVSHDYGISGFFPTSVVVGIGSTRLVFLESVAVGVAVMADPGQGPVYVGPECLECVAVPVSSPCRCGDQHIECGYFVSTIAGGVRDEVENGEFAMMHLVLDHAGCMSRLLSCVSAGKLASARRLARAYRGETGIWHPGKLLLMLQA
ncbi:MAG: hypothetical protein M0Z39_01460 [Actinomycetota bacterium]|nr:hypothetical protein [Actinomycetota bacterium]